MKTDAPPPKRKRKFYAEDVAEWRLLHSRGWSYSQLGREWEVSPATICLCLAGKYGAKIVSRGEEAADSGR